MVRFGDLFATLSFGFVPLINSIPRSHPVADRRLSMLWHVRRGLLPGDHTNNMRLRPSLRQ